MLKTSLTPRFYVCFRILITSLGKEEADLCAFHIFVSFACACLSFAAVCDFDKTWTFLFTFFESVRTCIGDSLSLSLS